MSTASKVTLAVTSVVSLGIIWAVHNKQVVTLNKIEFIQIIMSLDN